MKTKCLIAILLFTSLTSCVKTKVYNINDENRVWLADSTNCHFTMQDENGVSQTLSLSKVWQSWLEGSGSFLFVTIEKTEHEYLYQHGRFSFGWDYSVSLEAYKQDDNCDDFWFRLGDAAYTMRVKGEQFYPVSCSGWNFMLDTMCFNAEYLDAYAVMNTEYYGVMHLEADSVHDDYFPTDIYYAKNYGLIQFSLKNGLKYCRLAQ